MFCFTNFITKKNIDVCFQKMLSSLSNISLNITGLLIGYGKKRTLEVQETNVIYKINPCPWSYNYTARLTK